MSRSQKKETAQYSARKAALGGRSLKCGQSRFYLGYKKHTLRLWLRDYASGVLLVPLVSWAAPANVFEGGFLRPSLAYCQRALRWRPDIVVGDMGYLDSRNTRLIRQQWHVAVVTRFKPAMRLVKPFASAQEAVCEQGQALQWLGYEGQDNLHWFGVAEADPLCLRCWQASQCPRQFSHSPEEHETLLGLIPTNTRVSRRLLSQVRPWIEPAQSYEKNRLGLSDVFFNSLRLVWTMSLLADAAVLLRARALVRRPARPSPLFDLTPAQLPLDLEP